MSEQPSRQPEVVHGIRRIVYIGLGCAFVGLGGLGVALPILPTTPFVLLASYFFIRSSPRLNAWLLKSKLFGGLLRDWQHHRGVRRNVKFTAITVIPVVVLGSIYFGRLILPLMILLIILGLVGLIVVIRLPVVTDLPEADEEG